MFCDEALDTVEAIAAGDLMPDGRVASHLATCPNCALALTRARQLEASLQRRAVPAAPAQFTSRTLARIRRARWRSDQFLDVGFNVAIGLIVLAVLGGVWMLLHRTGLAGGEHRRGRTSSAAASWRSRKRVAPALPLYVGAAALLVSALGVLVVGGAGCGAVNRDRPIAFPDYPITRLPNSSVTEMGGRQAAAAAALAPLLSAGVQPLHRAVLRQRRGVLRSVRHRPAARSRRRADRLERRI